MKTVLYMDGLDLPLFQHIETSYKSQVVLVSDNIATETSGPRVLEI